VASAAKARFLHGGRGQTHAGNVLRLEKQFVGDLRGLVASGGLPDAATLATLSNDAGGLQRRVVAALPRSIADACAHSTLPGGLFGDGLFLF
jgi:hypothetical protein